MATRQRAATTKPDESTIFQEPGEGGAMVQLNEPAQYIDDGIPDDLHNALTMLSGGDDPNAKVKIYRVTKGEATPAFCMEMTPADFAANHESVIQSAFGGGRYQIKIYASNPNNAGRVSMIARSELTIASAVNAPATENPDLRALLDRLERAERNAPAATPPVDTLAAVERGVLVFSGIVGALSPLLAPVFSRMMNPAPVAEKSSLIETLEAMKTLREVAGDLTGAGGGEKSDSALMMDAVRELAPVLQQAMSTRQAPEPHGVQPLAQPAPRLETHSTSTEPMKAPVMDMMFVQLSMLAGVAKRGASPSVWADNILDTIDEKEEADLLALLESPTWFADLCAKNPAVSPYAQWFGKLREEILAAFSEEPEPPLVAVEPDLTKTGNDDTHAHHAPSIPAKSVS